MGSPKNKYVRARLRWDRLTEGVEAQKSRNYLQLLDQRAGGEEIYPSGVAANGEIIIWAREDDLLEGGLGVVTILEIQWGKRCSKKIRRGQTGRVKKRKRGNNALDTLGKQLMNQGVRVFEMGKAE